ncbi:uncharacterized protein LOC135085482 [Ostrinia nubilalis]|uniref:uncharacterized protein LOC135085482 n=1 Tax=Ostrinia nubilalis TaxID=29057 RepID=UPI0030823007
MGAKDSVKFKVKRSYQCDSCEKKFANFRAMKVHVNRTHNLRSRASNKQQLTSLLGKSVKTLDSGKGSSKLSDVVDPAKVSHVRKIQYECPQCKERFAVYFSAFRHIQKYHCVNSKGRKVAPNSIEMIKPIRIEVCMKCNANIQMNDPHEVCAEVSPRVNVLANYICTGCKQQFGSLMLFDMHVSGLHCDDVETLFFPSRNEFNSWKEDVESQTKVKYLLLGKSSNIKQVYHCTCKTSDSEDDQIIHFCPSSMCTTDFTKSIQVHFYKTHFGHECEYTMPDKFKKYLSKQLLKEPAPLTEPFELKNLYADFKTLMEFILDEAKKVDKQKLEVLFNKARDMIGSFSTEEPTKTTKKSMTDAQISETLETLDVKRKISTDNVQVESKKIKLDLNLDEDSLENVEVQKKTKRKQTSQPSVETKTKLVTKTSPCSSLSSFNDSYKDFVDKNLKEAEVLNKKANDFKKFIKQEKEVEEPPQKKTVNKPNIVRKKKNIVKTKIGQFKPSLSPKIKSEDESSSEHMPSIKVEFEYEVREQENDCNILVLKI